MVLAGCLFGCTDPAEESGYHIELTINGEAPEEVYLAYRMNENTYVADTARVLQGNVVFSDTEPLAPGLYMVLLPPENNWFEFVVDEQNQHFEIITHTKHLSDRLRFEHSPANSAFVDYLRTIQNKRMEMEGLIALEKSATPDEVERLNQRQDQINEEVARLQQQLISDYEDHFLGPFIASTLQPEVPDPDSGMSVSEARDYQYRYYKAHYFDDYDLSEPGLIRTAGYHQKIDAYLSRLVSQDKDSVLKEVDMLIQASSNHPRTKQAMSAYLLNKYAKEDSYTGKSAYAHIALTYYADTTFTDWIDEGQREKILENARRVDSTLNN